MVTCRQVLLYVLQLLGAFVFPLYLGALVVLSWALGWSEHIGRWRTTAYTDANGLEVSDGAVAGSSAVGKATQGPFLGSPESRPVIISVARDVAVGSPAWQLLEPLVHQYGQGILSQSMLHNPEFHHFYVAGKGSLVFCRVQDYGRCVVAGVGDPLAAPAHWEYLTQAFLAYHPRASFLHASEPYARLLAAKGYLVNELGRETVLQAQSYRTTKTLRRSARQARDAGVCVRELSEADLTPDVLQALERQVTDSWLQQKVVADRQIRIFVRHADYQRLCLTDGTRLFVVEEGAKQSAAAGCGTAGGVAEVQAAAPPKPKRRGQTKARAMRQLQQWQQQQGQQDAAQQHHPQQELVQELLEQQEVPHQRQLLQQDLQEEGAAQTTPAAAAAGPAADADTQPSTCSSTPDNLLGHCKSVGCSCAGHTCSSCSSSSADMKLLLGEGSEGSEGAWVPHVSAHVELVQLSQRSSKAADALEQSQLAGDLPGTPKLAAPVQMAQLDTCGDADQATPVGAGQSQQQQQQKQQAGGAAGRCEGCQGIIKGFLLLDPLWEAGRVTGYVTAILRTTPDAHPGAIKLLVEEALAVLRQEGKTALNFGFSPLWNSQDAHSQLPGAWWAHWSGKFFFHCGNNLYAFKNLAFSKTRYGGGLVQGGAQFRDANVLMPPVYMATYSTLPGLVMLDFFILIKYVGFYSGLLDVAVKLLRPQPSSAGCSSS